MAIFASKNCAASSNCRGAPSLLIRSLAPRVKAGMGARPAADLRAGQQSNVVAPLVHRDDAVAVGVAVAEGHVLFVIDRISYGVI